MNNLLLHIDDTEKKINKLNEEYKDLINRISGLTDDILKEQAREEYEMLEYSIINYKQEMSILKKVLDFKKEEGKYHKTSYILKAIELNNGLPEDFLKKKMILNRCKIPTSINNHKEIIQMTNTINCTLIIKDIKNNEICKIGKGKNIYILILYTILNLDGYNLYKKYFNNEEEIYIYNLPDTKPITFIPTI